MSCRLSTIHHPFLNVVPNPCTDLHIKVKTSGGSELDVAELAVGKYPNVKPTFNNLQYVKYKQS